MHRAPSETSKSAKKPLLATGRRLRTQGIKDSYEHGVYEGDFEDGDDDDIPSNPSTETPLADIIQQRLSRRTALKGLTGVAATAALGSTFLTGIGRAAAQASTLGFREVAHDTTAGVQTAPGYSAQVLIRWEIGRAHV